MFKKIIATGTIFLGLVGILNPQELRQPDMGKKIQHSAVGPHCEQDNQVVRFRTTNNGRSFYLFDRNSDDLIEKKPYLFQEFSEKHKAFLSVYMDPEREGSFIEDPFPYPLYFNKMCSIANDLDKLISKEIDKQPFMGKLRITNQTENVVSYQSHDKSCESGLKYTGYLHENGWAVHEKKKSGEQIQIPFAFLSGLTIYIDPNIDRTFDYKIKFDSSDVFCKILEGKGN